MPRVENTLASTIKQMLLRAGLDVKDRKHFDKKHFNRKHFNKKMFATSLLQTTGHARKIMAYTGR